MLDQLIKTRVSVLKEDFNDQFDRTLAPTGLRSHAARYRRNPAAFAKEVLGSTWWSAQEAIARDLVRNRRVAVKSANAVGKTYLAADLALWFLYTHQPSIVITFAPTDRQVRLLLWQEIRKRHTQANSVPSSSSSSSCSAVRRRSSVVGRRGFTQYPTPNTQHRLPGNLLTQRLMVKDGWYAVGYATDQAVNFQGFHCQNLLIIFDEASGIPESIWEAAEGVAVGENNKILALGNPLQAEGQFYRCFARPGLRDSDFATIEANPKSKIQNPKSTSGWSTHTISAIDHPNIIEEREVIPGCVTIPHLEDRIAEWCEKIESEPSKIVRRLRRTKPGRSILSRRGQNPKSKIQNRIRSHPLRPTYSNGTESNTVRATSSAPGSSGNSPMETMNL